VVEPVQGAANKTERILQVCHELNDRVPMVMPNRLRSWSRSIRGIKRKHRHDRGWNDRVRELHRDERRLADRLGSSNIRLSGNSRGDHNILWPHAPRMRAASRSKEMR
jgi:hypothetical protein